MSMITKNSACKIILITLLLIIQFHVVFCQKNFLPVPPNCVNLNDNVYIDKTEIKNIHWLEYLHHLKRDSSQASYKAALPDTSVWLVYRDTSKYKHYLSYPVYRDFPVVGITQQQAANYCQWRSHAVTKRFNTAEIKNKAGLRGNVQISYTFRLPTEEEWMKAAAGSLDPTIYPYGYVNFMRASALVGNPAELYKKTNRAESFDKFQVDLRKFNTGKNEPMFNVLKKFDNYFFYGENFPRMITYRKGEANTLGIDNMIGNVAEIVAEPGFVKGGGWANTLEDSRINSRQQFTKPTAWIGFRCVCEVEIMTPVK